MLLKIINKSSKSNYYNKCVLLFFSLDLLFPIRWTWYCNVWTSCNRGRKYWTWQTFKSKRHPLAFPDPVHSSIQLLAFFPRFKAGCHPWGCMGALEGDQDGHHQVWPKMVQHIVWSQEVTKAWDSCPHKEEKAGLCWGSTVVSPQQDRPHFRRKTDRFCWTAGGHRRRLLQQDVIMSHEIQRFACV